MKPKPVPVCLHERKRPIGTPDKDGHHVMYCPDCGRVLGKE